MVSLFKVTREKYKSSPNNRKAMLWLTYVIPIFNVFLVIFFTKAKGIDLFYSICSPIAGSVAASACTTRGIGKDTEENDSLRMKQTFALIISVIVFFITTSYIKMDGSASIFKSGFFYVTIGLITLISVILAVNMFLIVDSQLDKMIEDVRKYEKEDIKKSLEMANKATEKAEKGMYTSKGSFEGFIPPCNVAPKEEE